MPAVKRHACLLLLVLFFQIKKSTSLFRAERKRISFALFFLRKEKGAEKKNCKCRLYPDRLLSCCFLASSKATRNRRWSYLCNPELRSAACRFTAEFDEKISRVRVQSRPYVDAPFCVVPPYIWSERDKLRAGSKTVCNEWFALGSQAIDLQGRLLLLVSFLAEARKVRASFAEKEKMRKRYVM